MAAKAYITILGRSSWALINTYYGVLRERGYYPDEIHIFTEKMYKSKLPDIISALKIISEGFSFSPEFSTYSVTDVDFYQAGKKIQKLVKSLKSREAVIAIDITPGRRALIAAALIPAMKMDIDHIYYLAISNTDDAAKPYMMIPIKYQKVYCFMDAARGIEK